jgi:hypothetical protein
VETIVSDIPTTEEGCAFTTTGVKDPDEVLHPQKFYMSNRRAITLCIISMYLIQCSAMDAPWGKSGCSLQERSLKIISKCYAPASGVAGPQDSAWQTAYSTARMVIGIAKESSDMFLPLKTVVGALSVLIKNYDVSSIPATTELFCLRLAP